MKTYIRLIPPRYLQGLRLFLLATVFVMIEGCAHPIVIAPPTHGLEPKTGPVSTKSVAYFISRENREKQVITDGGGGDKVSYFPYKDLETAFYKSLSGVFGRVYTLDSPGNQDYLRVNNIKFVFTPTIETHSFSTGVFTWPPTDFSITLDTIATDADGKRVWNKRITGNGHAEYQEFLSDFALSSKRAGEQTFRLLQEALISAPEFGHEK